jgi:hypothetical protein
MRTLAQQHVGYAAGAGLGALVLSADRPAGYLAAIAGDAVSFLVLAVVTASVPAVPPLRAGGRGGTRLVLRDRPYLAVTGVTAVLSLCWAMLSTGLPLWISRSTDLPLSLSGAVVVISSVGIAVLQVPASRLARGTGPAGAPRPGRASPWRSAAYCWPQRAAVPAAPPRRSSSRRSCTWPVSSVSSRRAGVCPSP